MCWCCLLAFYMFNITITSYWNQKYNSWTSGSKKAFNVMWIFKCFWKFPKGQTYWKNKYWHQYTHLTMFLHPDLNCFRVKTTPRILWKKAMMASTSSIEPVLGCSSYPISLFWHLRNSILSILVVTATNVSQPRGHRQFATTRVNIKNKVFPFAGKNYTGGSACLYMLGSICPESMTWTKCRPYAFGRTQAIFCIHWR